jgi:hypothetical protein
VLSILVWWAIPAVAVLLAALVLAVSRRVRRAREDVGAQHRYQRAIQALERTQHSVATRPNPSGPHSQPERTSLPTTE